jgi:hypothetical protein
LTGEKLRQSLGSIYLLNIKGIASFSAIILISFNLTIFKRLCRYEVYKIGGLVKFPAKLILASSLITLMAGCASSTPATIIALYKNKDGTGASIPLSSSLEECRDRIWQHYQADKAAGDTDESRLGGDADAAEEQAESNEEEGIGQCLVLTNNGFHAFGILKPE